jgi:microcin C transport system permease protein
MKLSPLNKRRIENFKSNKRGYYSFLIFMVLFVASLFSEFIANDRPIFVSYKGGFYFPVFKEYKESDFAGGFETAVNFKDDFIISEIEANGFLIWPPVRYSYSTINYNLDVPAPSPPTLENFIGTDDQGRDVLARVIYGLRISVLFGLILSGLSCVIGIILGAVKGYYAGRLDLISERFIEIWGSIPTLFLLIILASFIKPNFWLLLSIMLLFSWMGVTSVVRAEVLKTRNFDYVTAAKALGVSERKIIFKHILPNSLVATISMMPFIISSGVTALTALDFLGLGLPAGSASLGELLAQGKNNLHAPWLGLTGFFVLAIMLSLLVFIGEAIRDAFHPNRVFVK